MPGGATAGCWRVKAAATTLAALGAAVAFGLIAGALTSRPPVRDHVFSVGPAAVTGFVAAAPLGGG